MGVFCGHMKNQTRPTPETDAKWHAGHFVSETMAREFAEKLERERDELREALAEFCKEQDWACDEWKRQPHIARLFKLNKKP